MPASRTEELPLRSGADVVKVRQVVRTWAAELGFSLVDQTKLVTGASELAIGTGTPGATALGNEIARKAVYQRSTSGRVTTYAARWDIEDQIAGTITECGIFNDATPGGTMLCSNVLNVTKNLYDDLLITIANTI